MNCQYEGCDNPREGNTLNCASHNHWERDQAKKKKKKLQKQIDALKYRMPKQSKKEISVNRKYTERVKVWIVGKACAVYPHLIATQCHHMKGRGVSSYADQWAKDNGIPLRLDERFWLPVSDEGHRKITDDSAWAIQMGFSIKRNGKSFV